MSEKIKNSPKQNINEIAAQLGITMMAVATAAGLLPHVMEKKAVLSSQGTYIQPVFNENNNDQRRERDDHGIHRSLSSVEERTPGRTGKL